MPRLKRTPAEQRLADAAGPEFLEALARGLRIIQAFNSERRQLTLSDIARLVDLPRASVRRTLHTLRISALPKPTAGCSGSRRAS